MLSTDRNFVSSLQPPALGVRLGWYGGAFVLIVLVALIIRLWGLDGRAMHYDESLHLHYSWSLAVGEGYSHSPWMHGPFQVHLTAFMFKLFSDSDFTGRLAYALFGTILVALPYFFRAYIGRGGALIAAVLLTLSPSVLYLSRLGRNEILMAVWAVAILILLWRYMNEGKDRYLYLLAGVLALAFASKETAYFLVATFGIALFVMATPEVVPLLLRQMKLKDISGPTVLLLLMVGLTLPLWSAFIILLPWSGGFDIVRPPAVVETGLPVWEAPFVNFPLIPLPAVVSALLTAALLMTPLGLIKYTRWGRQHWRLLVIAAPASALAYGISALAEGSVPHGYVISLGVIIGAFCVSVYIGLLWHWKTWLICSGIFLLIWAAFHTSFFGAFVSHGSVCQAADVGGLFQTMCSRLGGLYTGAWQGLAYWIPQHEVSRANQPWFYYIMVGSVYEFLPLLFGSAGAFYYLRRGELLGLMLSFWAVSSFFIYSIAGERMPWLVVNFAVPFILLTAKFIGDVLEGLTWKRVLRPLPVMMFLMAPVAIAAGVYLLQSYLGEESVNSRELTWAGISLIAVLCILAVLLFLRSSAILGMKVAGLGIGVLLLGFSAFVAYRTNYSYDDSPVELIVYSQGSADLVATASSLQSDVITGDQDTQVVEVDYEVWYPFNWYVRHEEKAGTLKFQCFKQEDDTGYQSYCNPIEEEPTLNALLLSIPHGNRYQSHLQQMEREGPLYNLLWFPELYRRPDENRPEESIFTEVREDLAYFRETFAQKSSWNAVVDYFLLRRIDGGWWDAQFYSYIAVDAPEVIPDGESG
ncbi:MAG: TIGR03663 family protein [Dehalococcoidia bacterium]|nr:TIGR03663 family protein [Dehalococcoidia bacterium]